MTEEELNNLAIEEDKRRRNTAASGEFHNLLTLVFESHSFSCLDNQLVSESRRSNVNKHSNKLRKNSETVSPHSKRMLILSEPRMDG